METEQLIQKTLTVLDNTTKIIIAHRISAVRNADEILVLENGSIVERGTHEQLIDHKGQYYETYLSQYGAMPEKGMTAEGQTEQREGGEADGSQLL